MKIILATAAILLIGLSSCSSANKAWLQENAPEKWKKQGFEVVDYEGYQWGPGIPFTQYGGARVWHRLRKIPDNGITYSGFTRRWGDEIMVYGPNAADAIRPDNDK